MSEKNIAHHGALVDPQIAQLSTEIHATHQADDAHNWDDIHSLTRHSGVFDVEQLSDDPVIRDRALERAKSMDDEAVTSFIKYIEGSMDVTAISGTELSAQIGTMRRQARCLSADGVSFEVVERAVDKIAEYETRLRMYYPDGMKSVASCVEQISVPMLQELYMYPSKSDKNVIAELLDSVSTADQNGLGVYARVLSRVYQKPSGLIEFNADDPYVKKMNEGLDYDEINFEIAMLPERPLSASQRDIAEFNSQLTQGTMAIMERMGLAERDEKGYFDSAFLRSAFVRLRNRPTEYEKKVPGAIDAFELQRELFASNYNSKAIGPENVKRLKESFGTDQLWMYDLAELNILCDVLDNHSATIEHLKAGDVTVVFSNAVGDYNGAIVEHANYKKESGRTLRFEFNDIKDVYRTMAHLKMRGIKASSAVYETHGRPGAVDYDGAVLWAAEPAAGMSTDKKNPDYVIDPENDGLYKLARDYMQPNRGIDSEDELIGKIQVIVSVCSSDAEMIKADGTSVTFNEQLARMMAHPSDSAMRDGAFGKDVTQSNIVMYGATNSMTERVLANGRIGFYQQLGGSRIRVATRRTVDEPGTVHKLFGTTRKSITTKKVLERKGVPVRRAS